MSACIPDYEYDLIRAIMIKRDQELLSILDKYGFDNLPHLIDAAEMGDIDFIENAEIVGYNIYRPDILLAAIDGHQYIFVEMLTMNGRTDVSDPSIAIALAESGDIDLFELVIKNNYLPLDDPRVMQTAEKYGGSGMVNWLRGQIRDMNEI